MNHSYNHLYGEPGQPTEQSLPEQPAVIYSRREQILSYLAMLLGFFFVRLVCYHTTGLLTTLFYWVLFTACLVYLKKSGRALSGSRKLLAAVLYIFAAVYTITANPLLKFLNLIFLLLAGSLLVFLICNPDKQVFRYLFFSMQKALFSYPFGGFGKCFGAAVSGIRGKAVWKNVLYILLGLFVALPLTAVVAALLCASDDNMAKMFEMLKHIPLDDMMILLPHLFFGILIGCYLFGMLYTNTLQKYAEPLDEAACEHSILALRILPNPMVYAAVTPICLLYILYFISQLQYFMGGFTGTLAEGFTYAEYARKGFFELCAVCCINFAVIGVMSFGARLCGAVKPLLLKLYTLFLSACSLFLAGTAIAKMLLYIENYGMTQLRVYTTWFMLLLIMGFVLILIRQFKASLPVCRIGFVLFTAMFGLLCFSRPDAWITRYNAEMYIAGELEEFDTEMIGRTLSDDAVAVLSSYQNGELSSYNSPADGSPIDSIIQESLDRYQDDFYQSLNISAWLIMTNGVTAE